MYCPNITQYEFHDSTDEACVFFREHETQYKAGIPGLGSGKFMGELGGGGGGVVFGNFG